MLFNNSIRLRLGISALFLFVLLNWILLAIDNSTLIDLRRGLVMAANLTNLILTFKLAKRLDRNPYTWIIASIFLGTIPTIVLAFTDREFEESIISKEYISNDQNDISIVDGGLLNEGLDPNIQNIDGVTALMEVTCLNENEDTIKLVGLLLKNGADVNIKTTTNGYALMGSVCSENYKISELLLKTGANPHIETNNQTAFRNASRVSTKMESLFSRYEI